MEQLLSLSTLDKLNPNVKGLAYDKNAGSVGIVHIGIGAFHRAHQAVFTNDLIALGDNQWKITAVSLRSANVRNLMQPQDSVYSVVERSDEQVSVSLVGAIQDVLVAPESPQQVVDVIASSQTKVVTLTVTEKGYCRDKSGLHLDLNNPDIQADLTSLTSAKSSPKTMPGFIVAACQKRQSTGDKLTVVSCDNLPSNGSVTKAVVLEFAAALDGQLASWIENNVSFCNSMVDRIVPAVSGQDVSDVANVLGLTDKSVVITEPFKQWVIEDNFASDKPQWDKVGALFVKDVTVYEDMKLRLLNGAHSTLAYIGFLMGYEYIHQAVTDKTCLAFVKALHADVLKTVEDVPGIDLEEYASTIIARFSNSKVPYKTTQVATDGSQKLAQRLISPAEILSKQGIISRPIALVVASWCRFLESVDEQGNAYTVSDPLADELVGIAQHNKADEITQVKLILEESGICSDAMLQDSNFIDQVRVFLKSIHDKGIGNTVKQFLAQ
ncbi:mannitol dehydrogenase family protein [Psychrosphaera sp. F3M07]|uniref:mannitol dehydrogenase family protein n=1 Tax=Psychrosphaera sp. F3M07 TaxID=2841560 RepID=UPI001C0988B3|nr:mannitol dehydrogenase family protein [Psychrosphaera sp. F3M07]MBU2919396.1 mannitol dehydrogenase family protein [Psychrosphaera sp. F3M07]